MAVLQMYSPFSHNFFPNIFVKTKNFAEQVLPVHMGPRFNFLKVSLDTVPLTEQSVRTAIPG